MLEGEFGIRGPLLDWLKSYLRGRQQVTIVNGVPAGILPVSYGIPQGSVLGPTLFSMFTNDLPNIFPCLIDIYCKSSFYLHFNH